MASGFADALQKPVFLECSQIPVHSAGADLILAKCIRNLFCR